MMDCNPKSKKAESPTYCSVEIFGDHSHVVRSRWAREPAIDLGGMGSYDDLGCRGHEGHQKGLVPHFGLDSGSLQSFCHLLALNFKRGTMLTGSRKLEISNCKPKLRSGISGQNVSDPNPKWPCLLLAEWVPLKWLVFPNVTHGAFNSAWLI